MARTKKPQPPPSYLEWPDIPDELWLPFVISLTGNQRRDANAIVSLAYIFNLDPEAIKYRIKEEMAEREETVFVHAPHPVLQ